MDDLFARFLEKETPKLNPTIMEGLATVQIPLAEKYLDSVFKSVQVAGLTYDGYARCTEEEEYLELSKPKNNNRRTFDIARSDLYLVKYKFSFKGEPLPDRYIYLPIVGEAGIIHLGGPMFHITPVLSDKVISPGNDAIFVRLLRDKINVRRCYHTLLIDGVRETTHVIYSHLYRKSRTASKVPVTTKAVTSFAHYLFAKHGLHETFQIYCGTVPVFGGEEINSSSYPDSDWVICESTQVKPKTHIGEFYSSTNLRIAVPKPRWTPMMKALIVGFFYVVDHFPDRLNVHSIQGDMLWRILLGHIIFSGVYGENRLYQQITDHFISLDEYLDDINKEKLRDRGYEVNDFYMLMAYLLRDFNNLLLENDNANLSMYNKNLEILYYVLFDITSGIFKASFNLSKMANKRALTPKDINETFSRHIRQGAIFDLTNGKVITETVAYSGDNKYPKITSHVTEQESSMGAARGRSRRLVVGPEQHANFSQVEAGSITFLSKSNPTPTQRINPFVEIDETTGTICPRPEFNELRKYIDERLKGRHVNQ